MIKTTSLNELVYELLEKHRGQLKDTDSLVGKLVIDWVQNTRAKLLKQRFEKPFRIIDQNLIQDLGDLQLENVPANELGLDDGSYVLRTVDELPTTIDSNNGVGTWTRVGSPNMNIPKFNIVHYERALVSGNGKFNYNRIYAFILGQRLYLWSKSGLHLTVDKINARGVFQNPIEAAKFADPTWTYNDNYPINKSLIDDLKGLIIDQHFKFIMAPIEDKVEGDSDKIEQNVATKEQRK